jgi:hypothetical protein
LARGLSSGTKQTRKQTAAHGVSFLLTPPSRKHAAVARMSAAICGDDGDAPMPPRMSRSLSSGRPLRAGPVGSSGLHFRNDEQKDDAKEKGKRSAERRIQPMAALTNAACALRSAHSPFGAPPRLLIGRPNARTQLRAALPGIAGSLRRQLSHAPGRPVIMPAGHSSLLLRKLRTLVCAAQNRPGTGLQGPSAGTAPAPQTDRIRRRPLRERDLLSVTQSVTRVNEKATTRMDSL